MRKFSGYTAIIIFLFFLSLAFYSIDEIFITRTLAEPRVLEIEKGEGADSVIRRLENENLIRNGMIVRSYLILAGIHKNIKPGHYIIDSPYSVKEMFDEFAAGAGLETQIREGLTVKEIAKILEEKAIIPEAGDFEKAAASFNNSSGQYGFLPQRHGINLEGYLFPDTYSFERSSPERIIQLMLDNFNKKVFLWFGGLGAEELNEAVVMASILEKEVQTEKDMRIVSGILRKRLETGQPLQADATLVYIKCSILEKEECRTLSSSDKNLNSKYNTYLNLGLPPGAISNPGLTAINSALSPEVSPYWYYLSAKDDGRTIFSRTLGEHNLNKSVYR